MVVSKPKPPVAAMDRPDMRTVEFINRIFPDEASLVAIDPLLQKLRNKIRRVDAEILLAVRQQSSSGTKAKEDLAAAMKAIQELSLKLNEIKGKSEQSEVMVQEICRDIKKLDYAKKHITATITALNRLAMLVLAVDRLQQLAANKQYREGAGQLEAVNQLVKHFESYEDIPRIRELREKFHSMRGSLQAHVFADFASLNTPAIKENVQAQQQLADACFVVDSLDPVTHSVRQELIRSVCSKELTAYQQIFQGTDVAKLDKAERRYSWIHRQLKMNEDLWRIFPRKWRVPHLLCVQFCKITRAQLMEQLDGSKDRPHDVAMLLQALERTLEFEEDLAQRFEQEDADEAKEAAEEAEREEEEGRPHGSKAPPPPFPFRGSISSAFDPHLGVYISLEERTLMDVLDKLTLDETWEADPTSHTNILSSSTQLFLSIRKSFNRCCQLTRGRTLLELFKVFQRILRAYAAKLSHRLPKAGGAGAAAAMGGSADFKASEKEERVICYIVNTAEYCHETIAQLAESIQNRIDHEFVDSVDIQDEQDEFSGLITRCLSVLVVTLESRLDLELERMTRGAWATMESVGDQSEYVNNVSSLFSSSIPMIAGLLSHLYFQYFLDKMAASFAPRFYVTLFKCRRISGTGAQQLLLDTHAIKTILMELPALGGQTATVAYTKYVTKELGKPESLLKCILSPPESLVHTFHTLLPDASPADFQRVLDLKGVKKQDHQPLLDSFVREAPKPSTSQQQRAGRPTATASSSLQQPSLPGSTSDPSRSSFPGPSSLSTAVNSNNPSLPFPTSSSVLSSSPQLTAAGASAAAAAAAAGMLTSAASRDAMIARAAALGRGAMAQSAAAAAAVSQTGALKKIFALAESAKEGASKRDIGSLKKLFNA